jgi:hypothetical protein
MAKKYSTTMSAPYFNDLKVLLICNGIFTVVRDKEAMNELYESENSGLKKYSVNWPKGYEEMLDTFIDDIQTDIRKVLNKSYKYKDKAHTWLSNNMIIILQKLAKYEVTLEILASYMMYYNFKDREVLHEYLKPFEDTERYNLIVSTLEAVGIYNKIGMSRVSMEALDLIKLF